MRTLSDAERAKIVSLHVKDGVHASALATRFGVTHSTVCHLLKAARAKRPRPEAPEGDGRGIAI